MLARALDTLHRQDGGRVLAGLLRRFRSFDVAEDALQDAYAKALQRWPIEGIPGNPTGWITIVARRCALDRLRHQRRHVSVDLSSLAALDATEAVEPDAARNTVFDDRLTLMFLCCHPALAPSGQVALTLRSLCGLKTREIARAFIEPAATTAQKLTRAKRKIARAGIAFDMPAAEFSTARLAAVLAVIYFIFNEGYVATSGDDLLRPNLCLEAVRLGRLLHTLMPDQPEVGGLLALMLFHESRSAARTDLAGNLLVLEEQNRGSWDRNLIDEATAMLEGALLQRRTGPYQLQAAIAALHARAPAPGDTDWAQISALYGALLMHLPTPVVELNAAVALAMSTSIEEGLRWIDRIENAGALTRYHLLHAARADLLRRSGRRAEARAHYLKAWELTDNGSERRYLERRIGEMC